MSPTFFIFGFGYTAQFLATKLSQLGFEIVGTTRKSKKIDPSYSLIDFFSPDLNHHLSKATHILVSIPPAEIIADITLSNYKELIKTFSTTIKWIGYLSSTGVYGDHQGKWVDESSICKPLNQSGILRLKAEQAWLSFAEQHQLPVHIFRLAGIYGPGRNALERLRLGKEYSIYKEGQVFSRIHVEDLVSTIIGSINAPHPFSIYNVADDAPASSHVVDAYAAYLLNKQPLPLMPFEDAVMSSMEKEFYSNNRRVANFKIKKELNIRLQYPSFREGLKQCQNHK